MMEITPKGVPDSGELSDEFPTSVQAHPAVVEAEKAYGLQNFDESAGHYQRAGKCDPTLYVAALYIGDYYFLQGKWKQAVEAFARAI